MTFATRIGGTHVEVKHAVRQCRDGWAIVLYVRRSGRRTGGETLRTRYETREDAQRMAPVEARIALTALEIEARRKQPPVAQPRLMEALKYAQPEYLERGNPENSVARLHAVARWFKSLLGSVEAVAA